LSEIPGVRVYGSPPTEPRTPTVSFTAGGVPSDDVCRRLAESGVFASHGDFYATTAVRRLGAPEGGLVRVGCACYTTDEEIVRLLAVVRDLATSR
jgi:selenocysteine lyase/cysteine desulfurase